MRYVCYRENGKFVPAILSPDGKKAISFEKAGVPFSSLLDMITAGYTPKTPDFTYATDVKALDMCAPIPRPSQDIICLGINYTEHAQESAKYKKEAFERERDYPVYFAKRATAVKGSGEKISLHKNVTQCVDYEAELAFVLSKTAQNVKEEEAYDYVFGYTVLNDISARDLQTRHKQWYFGKSLDGFTAMGPCIVSKDELKDPENLKICSYVNGELRQNSNTSLMIFKIPRVIAELSSAMTLEAGTIITMGTPAGVGMGFVPPRFLNDNDEVVCEIEGIGKLKNNFYA